jgi:TetR/AcrR family transcriptional repressor of lmrAB and yxaGH operons
VPAQQRLLGAVVHRQQQRVHETLVGTGHPERREVTRDPLPVVHQGGAPRGSVYFHFPGGKARLGTEAAEAHAHEQFEIIDRAAGKAGFAAQLERYIDLGREGMTAGNYGRGCAIAPLVTEGAAQKSAELSETSRRGFSEMTGRLAFHFVAFGVDRAAARVLAHAVIAGVGGAMITSRALRSPAP